MWSVYITYHWRRRTYVYISVTVYLVCVTDELFEDRVEVKCVECVQNMPPEAVYGVTFTNYQVWLAYTGFDRYSNIEWR